MLNPSNIFDFLSTLRTQFHLNLGSMFRIKESSSRRSLSTFPKRILLKFRKHLGLKNPALVDLSQLSAWEFYLH
jgi:hypothetical protein